MRIWKMRIFPSLKKRISQGPAVFVTVLILYPTLLFLAFRAYLLEPPPQDYITKGKTIKKSQNSNEVKNGCTRSRIRIVH